MPDCCDCGGPIDRPGKPRCQKCYDRIMTEVGAMIGKAVGEAVGDAVQRVSVRSGGQEFDVTPSERIN